MLDLIVRNCTLADGRSGIDIGVEDGRIVAGSRRWQVRRARPSMRLADWCPRLSPSDALIVLDRVLRAGVATYSYHHEGDAVSIAALAGMRASGNYDHILAHKEAEHRQMLSIAESGTEMDSYLARAPRGTRYGALAALIV